ncbi:hypothetical protein ABN584_25390 [Gloeocapsa sp. BRSZ]
MNNRLRRSRSCGSRHCRDLPPHRTDYLEIKPMAILKQFGVLAAFGDGIFSNGLE